MKIFAITMTLLFSVNAMALTRAEKKEIRQIVWQLIQNDGSEPELSPEITSLKIQEQGTEAQVRFTWIEAFSQERVCFFSYDLAQKMITSTINCRTLGQ